MSPAHRQTDSASGATFSQRTEEAHGHLRSRQMTKCANRSARSHSRTTRAQIVNRDQTVAPRILVPFRDFCGRKSASVHLGHKNHKRSQKELSRLAEQGDVSPLIASNSWQATKSEEASNNQRPFRHSSFRFQSFASKQTIEAAQSLSSCPLCPSCSNKQP